MLPPPPISTLFPYTTLFRSRHRESRQRNRLAELLRQLDRLDRQRAGGLPLWRGRLGLLCYLGHLLDRKSTRLNSSHVEISYAVFCLKKKKDFYVRLTE